MNISLPICSMLKNQILMKISIVYILLLSYFNKLLRSMQKFSAPSSVRKHPETFCRTFVILRSRSASLFVNGTVRSLRKSKTAVFRTLNRNARLCPMRRFRRPRFFRFDRGVRGGWFSWNVIACSQQASYRRSISLIASGSTASRP